MKPRITVITLAVADLERSLAFYRDGLGLPTSGITGTKYAIGACVFFQLEGGLKLALWPRSSLQADTGLAHSPSGGRRRAPAQTRPAHLLGRLWRLLPGPGRPRLGGGVQPPPADTGVIGILKNLYSPYEY
jgi:catechol 2,3-dioxygenase-like lactoylglutathione lyase family enzyme